MSLSPFYNITRRKLVKVTDELVVIHNQKKNDHIYKDVKEVGIDDPV
jgi:hypothetical protein